MAELQHGGRLRAAAARYGIPLGRWLDLSTGINPDGWPVPPLPSACWQRLPEEDDGLPQEAGRYFGTPHLLACAGSQPAIQTLPMLRPPGRVGVIAPGYAEHAHAWRRAGHEVVPLAVAEIDGALERLQSLVVINPNNPTGTVFNAGTLLDWHARLRARGGWLVVDEAFADATPASSIVGRVGGEGLIVLRSLGKFFGLAGVRVGFVFAWPGLLRRLSERFGPWAVSHPAREVARLALADRAWQQAMRAALPQRSARLAAMLDAAGLRPDGGSALFQYVAMPRAAELHDRLAREGILVRLFGEPAALRFGLPDIEAQWRRFAAVLGRVS